MPSKICLYPGCHERISFKEIYCEPHRKQKVKEKIRKDYECREWAYLYKTAFWKRKRKAQLAKQPLCEECLRNGRIKAANTCDHIKDHKGNKQEFYHGALQSLCASCHSRKTLSENYNAHRGS